MKKIVEQLVENFKSIGVTDSLWEMAGVSQKRTGLKVYLYISPKQGKHGPRIKFVNGYETKMIQGNLVPMTISDSPEIPIKANLKISEQDLANLKSWVILNKDILLRLWNNEFDDETDAIQLLQKLDDRNKNENK